MGWLCVWRAAAGQPTVVVEDDTRVAALAALAAALDKAAGAQPAAITSLGSLSGRNTRYDSSGDFVGSRFAGFCACVVRDRCMR